MEREGGWPSLHQLVQQAVARGAETQEASEAAVAEVKATTAALARTVTDVHRCRERRRFGNGHLDVQDPDGVG